MTRNQLQYWSDQETARHNKVLEAQGLEQLVLQRENVRIANQVAQETARSNLAREAETNRANIARESNDLLRTYETQRSNLANEAIGRSNAAANLSNAATNALNAKTRQSELEELIRHNMETERNAKDSNPWTSIATTVRDVIDSFTNPPSGGGANIFSAWVEEKGKQVQDVASNLQNTINSVFTAPKITSSVKTVGGNNPTKAKTTSPKTTSGVKVTTKSTTPTSSSRRISGATR